MNTYKKDTSVANLKASKKDIIINRRNRRRNVHFKSLLKTRIKAALAAIASNSEEKVSLVRTALRTLDKAAGKGIVHKNFAARNKSSLSQSLNQSGQDTVKSEPEKTEKKVAKKAASKPKTTVKKKAAEKETSTAKTSAKKPASKKTKPSTEKKKESIKKTETKKSADA